MQFTHNNLSANSLWVKNLSQWKQQIFTYDDLNK